MHENWTIDQTYMKDPWKGELVAFDDALFVPPPAGLENGYVPIVVVQEKADGSGIEQINNIELSLIEVFPNPSSEAIFVKLPEYHSVNAQLMIVNMEGQVIREQRVSKRLESLDISTLLNGTYILVFKDGDHYMQTKFIKGE